jgi:hypothetical protein
MRSDGAKRSGRNETSCALSADLVPVSTTISVLCEYTRCGMLVRPSTPRTYFFAFAFVRAFSRSSVSATRSTKVSKEKPKKTKKLLSELSNAVSVKKGAPLPEWDGGLSKPAAKREWKYIFWCR